MRVAGFAERVLRPQRRRPPRSRRRRIAAPRGIPPVVFAVLLLLLLLPVPAGAACVGDCGGDGRVAVNELIVGVSIALGGSAMSACPSFDADGDAAVSVAELLAGVNNALLGCAAPPTPSAPPPSPTPTGTPTVTRTPASGPTIIFFGITSSDDSLQLPTGTDPDGVPIYERPFGFSFSLVIEAARRPGGPAVGKESYRDGAPPDLQVQSTRPLGNGSAAVCDVTAANFGGVPGIDPPRLEDQDELADAFNDFGCRFVDGVGQPVGRRCGQGCVKFESGESGCVTGNDAEVQFCAPVAVPLTFPDGDTLITARVRDEAGALGEAARLIVRVRP